MARNRKVENRISWSHTSLMECQVNRWDRAVLGTVKGRRLRRLRRILCTNAGELEPAHVLPVDSKRVLSKVSKRRAKTPSVQVVSLESIPIQVGRKWRLGGGVDPPDRFH